MRLIYPGVERCRALIIDSNPTLRSMLALMLREMGVGTVVQTGRVADARRVLETQIFDIVLCDQHFEKGSMTGQELLDDLRRAQLLPYATVFIMITGEASYTMVAEAAESALDSYLLKPHTALALEQRLVQARHRKTTLRGVFDAIEGGDFGSAVEQCRARFEARGDCWLYAARIGAELCLRQSDLRAAGEIYAAVQAARPQPWARLGLARVDLEAARPQRASKSLSALISDLPDYADAHDLLGRVQLEDGELDAALASFRQATRITPHSIARLQKQGMLAFHLDHRPEAVALLERSVRIGLGSKMFDPQSLYMLSLAYFDQRDTRALSRNHDNLTLALQRHEPKLRLGRFVAMSSALKAALERRDSALPELLQPLADASLEQDFDFEAAGNLIAVLVRLRGADKSLPNSETWIRELALRFCVSKASADLLCSAAQPHPASVETIRSAHSQISGLAEQAMALSVKGSHADAVRSLMTHGSTTFNAKLVDLAGMVLARHADHIEGSESLGRQVAELQRRYCGKASQVTLGGTSRRTSGALAIRH